MKIMINKNYKNIMNIKMKNKKQKIKFKKILINFKLNWMIWLKKQLNSLNLIIKNLKISLTILTLGLAELLIKC